MKEAQIIIKFGKDVNVTIKCDKGLESCDKYAIEDAIKNALIKMGYKIEAISISF